MDDDLERSDIAAASAKRDERSMRSARLTRIQNFRHSPEIFLKRISLLPKVPLPKNGAVLIGGMGPGPARGGQASKPGLSTGCDAMDCNAIDQDAANTGVAHLEGEGAIANLQT